MNFLRWLFDRQPVSELEAVEARTRTDGTPHGTRADRTCPHCFRSIEPPPQDEGVCPFCGHPVRVRTLSDGSRVVVMDFDRQPLPKLGMAKAPTQPLSKLEAAETPTQTRKKLLDNRDDHTCPHCHQTIEPAPQRGRACPFCGNRFRVRILPGGRRVVITEDEVSIAEAIGIPDVRDDHTCPHCQQTIEPPPQRGRACPFCDKTFRVRTLPGGRRVVVTVDEASIVESQMWKYELQPNIVGTPQRIVFFDLETLRSPEECGGWSNIERFGLAVGVTWTETEGFHEWFEPDARSLVAYLGEHDRVVGFNVLGFDYRVLSAYEPSALRLLRRSTVDMLKDIRDELGFRISLNDLAHATLGKSKTGKGDEAVRWWREGRHSRVVQYCRDDVSLTKELYDYGTVHGRIYYVNRQTGRKNGIPVLWGG